MKIHQLTPSEAMTALKSSRSGLTADEAARRLREFGRNTLEEGSQRSILRSLLREFTHFFAVMLWIAAALALFSAIRNRDQGMETLGIAIIGVIVVNGVFSFWQEFRAERAVAALRTMLPHKVRVMRDGEMMEQFAEVLVPGDLVELREGDAVPADCRVLEANSLRVDNSALTGESDAKLLTSESGKGERSSPLDATNLAWAGTSVVSGVGRGLVVATGMQTEFGKVAHATQHVEEAESPLRRDVARLSKVISLFSATLGGLFLIVGLWLGIPFWGSLLFAIGIIVANVPEGLLPTLTLSLAMAAQRMAKRRALVRHLPKIEVLGSATVICTDKTGTLTLNQMKAVQAYSADGFREIEQLDWSTTGNRSLLEGAFLCHDLEEVERDGRRELSGDPMELALVALARARIPPAGLRLIDRVVEVPFDTFRKRLSVVYNGREGRTLYCKGAPEAVFPLCVRATVIGSCVSMDAAIEDSFRKAQAEMSDRGLRVLAFAHRELGATAVPDEAELVLDGLVGIEDPPRPEVPAALGACRTAGIRVLMVTGDHPRTALAIARQIGLVNGKGVGDAVLSGEQLEHLSEAQLQLAIRHGCAIFARTTPEQKLRIVNLLKRMGEIVVVTGDGVNDAPALRSAHVGIAMGLSGTDVAKAAADVILLDDNFATIVSAVEEGRGVFENIRKFLTYILTSNIPELVPYLAFFLLDVPLGLTIVQILIVDLGTDMIPALGLGAERPSPDVMKRPPRPRSEPIVTPGLLGRAYLFLGSLEAIVAMVAYLYVLKSGGWSYGEALKPDEPLYRSATTACLTAIIVAQIGNVLACRDARESIVRVGLRSNPLILTGIVVELLVIAWVNLSPGAQRVFQTAPIHEEALLLIISLVLLALALEELRKAFVRRYSNKALSQRLS